MYNQSRIDTSEVAAIAAITPLVAMPVIIPAGWDRGIQLFKDAIMKHTNLALARDTLFTKMPFSNYSNYIKW